MKNTMSRRGFIAGATAMAALGALSGCTTRAAESPTTVATSAHTMCDLCSERCGCEVCGQNGTIVNIFGDKVHPRSEGRLCTCGFTLAGGLSSDALLDAPQMKGADGKMTKASWDDAIAAAGDAILQSVQSNGGASFAFIHDGSATAQWYGERFAELLGSAHVASAMGGGGAVAAAMRQVFGTSDVQTDIENAEAILCIGENGVDSGKPSAVAAYGAAYEKGAKVYVLSPTMQGAKRYASEWIPGVPGTELAFVLAVAHELVKTRGFDQVYTSTHIAGFDEWCETLADFTPEAAQDVTGIAAATVKKVASSLKASAPHACIVFGDAEKFGSSYANAGETARAAALVNAMLGSIGQTGGIRIGSSTSLADPSLSLAPMEKATVKLNAPLAIEDSTAGIIEGIAQGTIRSLVTCGVDLFETQGARGLADTLDTLDALVVLDTYETRTVKEATCALPLAHILERDELPGLVGGYRSGVAMGTRIVDVQGERKAADEIIPLLAQACGKDDEFPPMENVARTMLAGTGITYDGLVRIGSAVVATEKPNGIVEGFPTASGKVECASSDVAAAGLPGVPTWTATDEDDAHGEAYRLAVMTAPQARRATSENVPGIDSIVEEYSLDRIVINGDDAGELGVSDGGKIRVSNGDATGTFVVKTSNRVVSGLVAFPENADDGTGITWADFVSPSTDAVYGSPINGETYVVLEKVGA